jgi:hypothetical protein
MVAVSIAAGVISLLVPALLRQVSLGEQTNRLTAVEAVVSTDLDWFSKYAKIWKLKTGSYPETGTYPLTNAITKTTSSYGIGGAAAYEPSFGDCSTGLAVPLLADAQNLYTPSPDKRSKPYLPPYVVDVSSPTTIVVALGNVSGLNVIRKLEAVGNTIRIFYTVNGSNSTSLSFSREVSVLVEAAAWCDRLP